MQGAHQEFVLTDRETLHRGRAGAAAMVRRRHRQTDNYTPIGIPISADSIAARHPVLEGVCAADARPCRIQPRRWFGLLIGFARCDRSQRGDRYRRRGSPAESGSLAIARLRPRRGSLLVAWRRAAAQTLPQRHRARQPRRRRRRQGRAARRAPAPGGLHGPRGRAPPAGPPVRRRRASRSASAPPLHIGLLFDTSGSMSADMGMARSAAVKFCNLLQRAEDITLVDFDTEVRVATFGAERFHAVRGAAAQPQARRLDGAVRRARRLSRRHRLPVRREGHGHLHRWRRHPQRDVLRATR